MEEELNKIIKCMKENDLIDNGEISDTHHTFNDLYEHRCILYSVICNQNKEKAWKSKKHSDGTMYDNYFIVGLETPAGMTSYHYDMKYWDLFKVKEIPNAPEWDGYTPEDVLERLKSLTQEDMKRSFVNERHNIEVSIDVNGSKYIRKDFVVSKDLIKELRNIDNIDEIQCKLKQIIGE